MARSCWRLLAAACSLIFVASIFAAPIILRGQDAAADRSSFFRLLLLARELRRPATSSRLRPSGFLHRPTRRYAIRESRNSALRQTRFPATGSRRWDDLLRPRHLRRTRTVISPPKSGLHQRHLPGRTCHPRHVPGSEPDDPRVGRALDQRRALPRRRARLVVSLCPEQAGPHQSCGRGSSVDSQMDSQGRIVMSAQHIATFAADPGLGGKAVVSYADFAKPFGDRAGGMSRNVTIQKNMVPPAHSSSGWQRLSQLSFFSPCLPVPAALSMWPGPAISTPGPWASRSPGRLVR